MHESARDPGTFGGFGGISPPRSLGVFGRGGDKLDKLWRYRLVALVPQCFVIRFLLASLRFRRSYCEEREDSHSMLLKKTTGFSMYEVPQENRNPVHHSSIGLLLQCFQGQSNSLEDTTIDRFLSQPVLNPEQMYSS